MIILGIGCGDNDTTTANATSGDMAEFTKDSSFKEAHEIPATIEFKGKGSMLEFATPDGAKAQAHTIINDSTSKKYLFVIHEWYGLNNHIKQEAERLAENLPQVNVMALDIYDGKVADNRDDASKYMKSVTEDRAKAIINGALAVAGEDAEVATIGWCFGGGWSLKSSILAGEQGKACVIYYGMPVQSAEELAPIQADMLGIFAKQEKWINPEVVEKFANLAKATNKSLEVHSFDADHAFANPSSPRYNEEAAQKANAIALAFLKERI